MFLKGFYAFNNGYVNETHECWINKDHITAISNSDMHKDSYYLQIMGNDHTCKTYYIAKKDMDPILKNDEFYTMKNNNMSNEEKVIGTDICSLTDITCIGKDCKTCNVHIKVEEDAKVRTIHEED